MRLPLLLVLPILLIGILCDWYICRAVWQRCQRYVKFWRRTAVITSVLMSLFFLLVICWPKKSSSNSDLVNMMWAIYAYSSVYIPKYIFVVFDLLGKLPQLWHGKRLPGGKIVPKALAIVTFVLVWYGAANRYNIDVQEVEYHNESLPTAFDGITMAQISDLHVGSYGTDTSYVSRLVDAVNALDADLVVFTGDIVNRRSEELAPFVEPLSRLHARLGVYSILGNHDYGDYYKWKSAAEKDANLQLLKDMQHNMGWKMLNNDYKTFYADGDSIVLIGVENIGDPPFPVYGDLDEAYPYDLADPVFKILLSHNPAHWIDDIAESPDKNIALTLSGHTHAMQVAIGGLSPAVLRYKTWGGMYSDSNNAHDLYVNIGVGTVGIPARIGATPEITLFTLRR